MTPDELEQMLNGEDIFVTLDVKTLVLDIIREVPQEDLLTMLMERLPELSEEFVRDYLYMKRT